MMVPGNILAGLTRCPGVVEDTQDRFDILNQLTVAILGKDGLS